MIFSKPFLMFLTKSIEAVLSLLIVFLLPPWMIYYVLCEWVKRWSAQSKPWPGSMSQKRLTA